MPDVLSRLTQYGPDPTYRILTNKALMRALLEYELTYGVVVYTKDLYEGRITPGDMIYRLTSAIDRGQREPELETPPGPDSPRPAHRPAKDITTPEAAFGRRYLKYLRTHTVRIPRSIREARPAGQLSLDLDPRPLQQGGVVGESRSQLPLQRGLFDDHAV